MEEQGKELFILQDSYPGEVLAVCYASDEEEAANKFGLKAPGTPSFWGNTYSVEVPEEEPSWWKNTKNESLKNWKNYYEECTRRLSPISWYIRRVESRMIIK
ncbi:hypothetical protein L6259_01160 [Candidatus Parcubacteria bacterium]|nr:hypothetical protein [Patescibacteria group bacterium]MCG2693876.1 hypothetical protein [Candidatus Parcubacteria bacterium]